MLKLIQRSLFRFSGKRSFLNRIKDKLLDEDEEDKQIVPTHPSKQPLNVKQEIEGFVELNQEIGDLERMRMRKLDEKLGTDTHFHETDTYEERLDSEHIMRRNILAQREFNKERDHFVGALFNRDPQKEVKKPWLRDFLGFQKQADENIPYPEHQKVYQEGDFFKYFEKSHLEINMVAQFDFAEDLYTKLLRLKLLQKEESVQRRYESLQNYSAAPIIYEKYAYYSRDRDYNIYQREFNKNVNFTLLQEKPEKLVVDRERIASILEPVHYELSLDIRELNIDNLYYDFQPHHKHQCFAVLLQSIIIVLLEDKHILIENVGNSFCFDGDNIIYIQKSDLDLPKSIIAHNIFSNVKTIIYQIQPAQEIDIININDRYSYICIDGESYTTKLDKISNTKQVDFNSQNTFYKDGMYLKTKDNTNVFFGQIDEFSVNEHFIAIHQNESLLILKENNQHYVKIEESQYSIQKEKNQIKNSPFYYFSMICPYKPFQILKYNVDMKSIALHYQECLPHFDHSQLIIENGIIYNPNNAIQFLLIKLFDSSQYQQLQYEDVIIFENGGAILNIIVNEQNQQQVVEQLQNYTQQLTDKIILYANGPRSGLIASYVQFHKQMNEKFHSLIVHNGTFKDEKLNCYDTNRVPTLRRALFTYDQNDENGYQTQKMVALLRENKHNKTEGEIGVNLFCSQDQIELEIVRLAYILSV